MSDKLNQVLSVIIEYTDFDKGSITSETKITDDLGLDSLDIVELGFRIEEAFDIEVSDDDLEAVTTVGDLVELIEKNHDWIIK